MVPVVPSPIALALKVQAALLSILLPIVVSVLVVVFAYDRTIISMNIDASDSAKTSISSYQ